ncbi:MULTISPECIES: DUF4190 domain-containing protein [unclassified Curtobacterium]|uniref:DUF4190 domain-containing protein n=1 Tax=unclassified Curtobacterium TaxID=257496 RepID=UPI00104FABE8|nr:MULTISPECIES: DUF4190 domain-containing protein [unclassified Curtobacterium]TCL79247.1 uncharacterized protein DUF4190 [Curtobacterium sp. PhB128]TCL97281.1 uncharacterized protein DUF4190 [Curtobacterium sp. PhB138]
MSTQYQSPQSSVPQSYGSVPHRTNTLAIISLVAAFVAPLIGFILGLVAMSQARRRSEGGRGLALAAVIVGGVVTLLYIGLFVTIAVLAANTPDPTYSY